MKKLIHDIFIREGFEVTEIKNLIFYKKKSEKDIVFYWLVVEVDDLRDVIELQDKWFDTCKKKMNLNDFDKNTSLLILTQGEKSENWKKEVLTIEENPFQFKKYVLGYDQRSLKELKQNSQNGNPESIIKLITDETVFNDYKKSYNEFTWQKLLYTIAQKIPFIQLNIETEKGLENLYTESKKNLIERNLYGYFKKIDKAFNEKEMKQLGNTDIDRLFSIIEEKG